MTANPVPQPDTTAAAGPLPGQLLLTATDAAALLHVSRTTIYNLMATGQLRPVHIGRACRITRAELERYVTHLSEHAGWRP